MNVKAGCAICLLLWTAPTLAAGESSEQAATAFYQTYMKVRPSGIPAGKKYAPFQPLLSRDLDTLMQAGAVAEADYLRKTKGEVPPLREGDIFTSTFEGATSFSIDGCEEDGDKARCIVTLKYDDHVRHPRSARLIWKDVLDLVANTTGWKVDDIEYGGNWQFGNHGRLTDSLNDAVKDVQEN